MGTYREQLTWPSWLHLLMILAWGAGAAGLLVLVFRHGPRVDQLVAFLVLAVVGYVWWRVRYLAVEAGPEGISYGFGGRMRRVPAERIHHACAEDYSAVRYMGWGYRLGWDRGERACSILGYRRGVRVSFDDEKGRRWHVFLSCAEPGAFLHALGPSKGKET